MADFITALTGETGITAANLWSVIVPAGGLLAVSILFKFGYGFITDVLNRFIKPKKKATK